VSEPLLRLVGLSKRFGDVIALDGISLDIAAGEFLTVLGASGSGKTTTLRLIAGFEPPTAGQILMNGADIAPLPPYRRNVNTVFQQYALFPHLDVRENVGYGLRMRGVPVPDRESRVAEALAMVQLGDLGARKPRQLSGGQQQRVALARALVNRPQLLLLDEPLGALDLKLRRAMQLELKHLQTRLKITFVYVTHDQEEALTMSDRIAVMSHGKVEQLGTPEELYERPRTRFVADFIGTTNLLTGAVEAADATAGTALVRLTGGDTCVVAGTDMAIGRTVELSVRPESILIKASNGAAPAGPDPIRGSVEQVAYLGGNVQYQVRTNGGLAITALAPKTVQRLQVGSDVDLVWPPTEALVLAGTAEREEEAQP